MRSEEYVHRVEEIADVMLPGMPSELRVDVHALTERANVLRAVNAATGLQFDVEDMGDGVAGYAERRTRRVAIDEAVLGDRRLALHVADHEQGHREHMDRGLHDLSLGYLSEEAQGGLRRLVPELPREAFEEGSDFLLEGYNEMRTIRRVGYHAAIAYGEQVAAAEALERACLRLFRVSLMGLFEAGDERGMKGWIALLGLAGTARGEVAGTIAAVI